MGVSCVVWACVVDSEGICFVSTPHSDISVRITDNHVSERGKRQRRHEFRNIILKKEMSSFKEFNEIDKIYPRKEGLSGAAYWLPVHAERLPLKCEVLPATCRWSYVYFGLCSVSIHHNAERSRTGEIFLVRLKTPKCTRHSTHKCDSFLRVQQDIIIQECFETSNVPPLSKS